MRSWALTTTPRSDRGPSSTWRTPRRASPGRSRLPDITSAMFRSVFRSEKRIINQRAPRVSSALSFIGRVHIGARALHVLNLIWFGQISRLSQWEETGNFLVQMIFTCLRYTQRRGGGSRRPVVFCPNFVYVNQRLLNALQSPWLSRGHVIRILTHLPPPLPSESWTCDT